MTLNVQQKTCYLGKYNERLTQLGLADPDLELELKKNNLFPRDSPGFVHFPIEKIIDKPQIQVFDPDLPSLEGDSGHPLAATSFLGVKTLVPC